jgi:hypothetical protein
LIDTCGNKDAQGNRLCNGLVDGQPVSTGEGKFTISFMFALLLFLTPLLFFKQRSCRIVIYVTNLIQSPLLFEAFGSKVTEMISTAGKTLLVLK